MKTKLKSTPKMWLIGTSKDAVFLIMDAVEQEITNITTRTNCGKYMSVSKVKVDQILASIKELRLSPVKTDILKNTDTG